MGTMSKGSEHRAQLGLTEHGSSGHVWETHTHTHKAIEETGMDPQACVEWRSGIEEGKRVGVQTVTITVSSNNVGLTVLNNRLQLISGFTAAQNDWNILINVLYRYQ